MVNRRNKLELHGKRMKNINLLPTIARIIKWFELEWAM